MRRAVHWYATHDRLHTGDEIAMAHDALQAYRADTAAGTDALLMCDTTEMCDALNQRIHDESINAEAPTVTAARGQRIAVGDLIISRRNDPTLGVFDATETSPSRRRIRCATAIAGACSPSEHHRIAARRLDDGARAAFSGDYLRGHITHGYAVTVHSAQGATADTTHAVLGEKCSRALLYVAVTRGRESNQAYLYERRAAETEHEQPHPDWLHVMRRGTSRDAAALIRNIIATRDDRARTAHDIAADTEHEQLPERMRSLLDRRTDAVHRRRAAYRNWCDANAEQLVERQRWIEQHISRGNDLDYGIDL